MIVPELESVRSKVLERLLVEDESVLRLDEVEVTDAIREGLDQFNVVAPLRKVYEVAGDGATKRFVLSTDVTGWVKSIGQVTEVEFVESAGTDSELVRRLRREHWIQSVAVNGDEVLNTQSAASSSETVRVLWNTYSTIQDLDGATATTIPEKYTEAFYLYAAHAGAMAVSRKAARLRQSSFGADVTSLDEVYQRWVDIARDLKKKADGRLGSLMGSAQGAGVSANWATHTRFGGGVRISHGS